ncbi:MAG: bifunctional ornithine acetyltransferase/N-acetylglutamate synthase [Spirochaetales bacterium]|nr:bifunctional ornithine acetyltransferase/N-acetylglutamate synthase [Spirochaetales bacterium]
MKPAATEIYHSKTDYEEALKRRAVMPEGFSASTVPIRFFPAEKPVGNPLPMNMSLILADEKTPSFGAVFTRNRFPGAPVVIGRKRCGKPFCRGILINNKVSNVCAPKGIENAETLCDAAGGILGIEGSLLIPSSTGIIGWRLPLKEMKEGLPGLAGSLSRDSLFPVARAIMTTDAFPKARSETLGEGRITAVAKGAGMIEPNMATLLVFILTDVEVEREALRRMLSEVVSETFNMISVDGDQSTSDSVIIMSSNKKPSPGNDDFSKALLSVCGSLAEDVVRNGEGTSHVIRVTVRGIGDKAEAAGIGKAVVNSPLVKTAVFGNDPNVGRIVGAVGDHLGNLGMDGYTANLTVSMGGIVIFAAGEFQIDREKEKALSGYLKEAMIDTAAGYPPHNGTVDIELGFGKDGPVTVVTGCDLSYGYVRENADYRS